MRLFVVVFAAFSLLACSASFAQTEFLGAVSPDRLRESHAYREYAESIDAVLVESGPGTELSTVVGPFFDDLAADGGPLDNISATRGGAGFGVLVPRFEHDIVQIRLADGSNAFATRVYTTVVLDIFADRGAFSSSRRLESVYSRGAAHVSVFPSGSISRREPTTADLVDWYQQSLLGALNQIRMALEADEVQFRRRAARVFQVEPVVLSEQSADFLAGIGWSDDLESADLLRGELAYLLHLALQQQLLDQGLDEIALLPPSLGWATGNVARLLEDRLPTGADLVTEPDALGRMAIAVQVDLQRAGVITGDATPLGEQRVAASRIMASLTREGVPLDEGNEELIARGGGAFLAIAGVPPTAVRGAWRESFIQASTEIAPRLVQRISEANRNLE